MPTDAEGHRDVVSALDGETAIDVRYTPRPVLPEMSIDPAALPRHFPKTTIGRLANRSGTFLGLHIVGVESVERHVDAGEHGRVDVAPEPRRRLRRLGRVLSR